MNSRDRLIFKMILKGWTYKRITAELGVSKDIVEDVPCRLRLYYEQPSVPSLISYLYENKLIENYELLITDHIPGSVYLRSVSQLKQTI